MSLRSRFASLRLRAAAFVAGNAIRSYYSGGGSGRLLRDWVYGVIAPNAAIQYDITALRERARDLARNNAIIAGFLNEVANNIVGADGIQLQSRVTTSDGKPNQKTNFAIEAAWKEWGYPENASIDGVDSWVDIQRQHIIAIVRDGESIIRKRPDADNDFGFAVQLIDITLLDENYNVPAKDGANEIRMGVELTRDGRPVAYHLWQRHPGDLSGKNERIPVAASEIVHDFVRLYPGQVRGVSMLAPILTDMKMLAGYEEAELVAARLQASQMGAIINKSEEAISACLADQARRKSQNPDEAGQPKQMEAAPGMLPELLPGQELQMYDPTHPSMAFEQFTKTILRTISRGLGVAYHTLTGDLRDTNYSSMRGGLLPERDHWRALQVWLSTRCHRRVFRWWVPAALIAGKLDVDKRISAELYPHEWKGRGWKWVDPKNDLEAAALEIQLGLNSRQRMCAERGSDFEDVVDELAYERDYARDADVEIAPPKKAQPGKPQPERDEPEARTRLAVIGGT